MSYQDLPPQYKPSPWHRGVRHRIHEKWHARCCGIDRTGALHADACLCGSSALAMNTNAPKVLRQEALSYPAGGGATVFGDGTSVSPEKAILANCSAVREWDSNGTNFGYRPELGNVAGEFGHNDFYAAGCCGPSDGA